MSMTFQLGSRRLDCNRPPYVIAEIGINHNGDHELAVETIDAAADAGADAVKFQTFRADEFMGDRELEYAYTSNGETVRESMYAMFKRLELPRDWHVSLQQHARRRGVEFLSSAADPVSADILVEIGVPAIKLASEDLINLPLLDYVARLGRPVLLSTGMADEAEIGRALTTLHAGGAPAVMLLHCVSLYPTPDAFANVARLATLRERFELPVGYSDHTRGIGAAVTAAALGALLIEKHFTLDRTLPGPDHAFSADPAELAELVATVRSVVTKRGDGSLSPTLQEREAARAFRRGVVMRCDAGATSVLTRDMLHIKRPGNGAPPHELEALVGRRLRRDLHADEPVCWSDVE